MENFQDIILVNNNFSIGIIVPITSKRRNYKNVKETDFFKILIPGFLETYDKSGKYNYNFYLGYDDDDSFYINNKEEMEKLFNKIFEQKIGFKMIEMINLQGKVGQIWSRLADAASKESDYLYQIGDDIKMMDSGWEDVFISELVKNNNIGVTGPNDINNKRILTQSFVHITHLKIFGDYYPPRITNSYIDDWITAVYKPNKIKHIRVRNSGGEPRYSIVACKDDYLNCLKKSLIVLDIYLNLHNLKKPTNKMSRRRKIIKKNTSHIPDDLTIGIITPVTSKKRNYTEIMDTDFFKILIPGFLETYDKSGKYNYNFYLGYDDDDSFYINNKEEMEKLFNKIFEQKIGFKMIEMINLQGKVGQIWSRLADAASKESDYLYQIGDDIKMMDSGWEDVFISHLLETSNIGVTGPDDINNQRVLTQSFVHTTHLKIFQDYFPKEIKNWYIDDWITAVYKPRKIKHIKVRNSGGEPRYDVDDNKDNYLKILIKSRTTLKEYLMN